jgi:glycogen(starch) synthase
VAGAIDGCGAEALKRLLFITRIFGFGDFLDDDKQSSMNVRVFYAAGPGDVIRAHQHWMRKESDPNQLPIGYSSEFCDFCLDIGAEAYIVSSHDKSLVCRDGPITLTHCPKPIPGAQGLGYHISELFYAFRLLAMAKRFRAKWAVLHGGSTHLYAMSLFRWLGMRTVVVLHNAPWTPGLPPRRPGKRFIAWLNSLFFRWGVTATIGVSPECIRQVEQLTRGRHGPLYEIRPQYRRKIFEAIPAPPPFGADKPFNILFSARMESAKGALDLLQMARQIEDRAPGRVRWYAVGSGADVEQFQRLLLELKLESIVFYLGWKSATELREVIGMTHATIVPTRSTFAEGSPKTAIESVLSGRPVITSRINAGIEILKAACVEAEPDNVESYVEVILKLIVDPDQYRALCGACFELQEQFYDGKAGLPQVLRQVISP